jgi:hypothetical protein
MLAFDRGIVVNTLDKVIRTLHFTVTTLRVGRYNITVRFSSSTCGATPPLGMTADDGQVGQIHVVRRYPGAGTFYPPSIVRLLSCCHDDRWPG